MRHGINKCDVCTINDMKNENWCTLKCQLRDYVLDKLCSGTDIKGCHENVRSSEFKVVIEELSCLL